MPAEKYLEIIKWGEERSGIKMLTPEYEVTAILFDVDQITPLEMKPYFSGSNASFYKILKSLEAKGVVSAAPNPSDRRSKLYRLSDNALTIMTAQWARYSQLGPNQLYVSDKPREVIRNYTKTVTRELRVKQFTCEYQIMLYLNANPGLANINFKDLVDVSSGKCNMSLDRLKGDGHIYSETDAKDKRMKLYYVSERDRALLEDMGRRIYSWMDSKSDFFEKLQRKTSQ